MYSLSVIICTHNPKRDYLNRVLLALKNQTLPMKNWELLLVDNASDTLLSREIGLDWHHFARHIREEVLGLTHARLRGIDEASSDLLVFVDDDNVLAPNFLEVALDISLASQTVGAWGGLITPEFEALPPKWMYQFLPMLAVREFSQDTLSNLRYQNDSTPCGAGLCLRRSVAETYVRLAKKTPKRMQMGRKGSILMAGEDSDLALSACDLGLFTGRFISLKLTHLISSDRVDKDYLLNLARGIGYSQNIVGSFRGVFPPPLSLKNRIKARIRYWLMHPEARQILDAMQEGRKIALSELNQ